MEWTNHIQLFSSHSIVIGQFLMAYLRLKSLDSDLSNNIWCTISVLYSDNAD